MLSNFHKRNSVFCAVAFAAFCARERAPVELGSNNITPSSKVADANPAQPIKSTRCGGSDEKVTAETLTQEANAHQACVTAGYTAASCTLYVCSQPSDASVLQTAAEENWVNPVNPVNPNPDPEPPNPGPNPPPPNPGPNPPPPDPVPLNFATLCGSHPVPASAITQKNKYIKHHGDAKSQILDSETYTLKSGVSKASIDSGLAEVLLYLDPDGSTLTGKWVNGCDNYVDASQSASCKAAGGLKIKTAVKCGACTPPCNP